MSISVKICLYQLLYHFVYQLVDKSNASCSNSTISIEKQAYQVKEQGHCQGYTVQKWPVSNTIFKIQF